MTDTGTFALVSPSGRLEFRTGDPQQMHADVSQQGSTPHDLSVIAPSWGGHGLHASMTSQSNSQPPNPLAATMIAALGGPDHHHWHGFLGLCGTKLTPPGVVQQCGLTHAQENLIRQIHAAARAMA